MLMEENGLPEKTVIFWNEHETTALADAAVLADEFTPTHKSVFSPAVRGEPVSYDQKFRSPKSSRRNPGAAVAETCECFYCNEQRHLISTCPTLKRKEQLRYVKSPSPISLIQTKPCKR